MPIELRDVRANMPLISASLTMPSVNRSSQLSTAVSSNSKPAASASAANCNVRTVPNSLGCSLIPSVWMSLVCVL